MCQKTRQVVHWRTQGGDGRRSVDPIISVESLVIVVVETECEISHQGLHECSGRRALCEN